jgi:hypothetical protein
MVTLGLLLLLCAGALQAQNPRFPAMNRLRSDETFHATKLTSAEREEIRNQLEKTSFDAPDSWEREVRVRRVSLGSADGLVVQGVALLCGGTGNCQTWVFRRSLGHWINLFSDQAPLASGFGFDQKMSHGLRRLAISANSSAERAEYWVYDFDGRFYRRTQCYEARAGGTAGAKETVKARACE